MTEFSLDEHLIKKNAIRPNSHRARIAQGLIWSVMVMDIISGISSYLQYDFLKAIQNVGLVSDQALNANDTREQIVGLLHLVVIIISTVTFIQWFRRGYYNLNQRTNCSYQEGWAAGCWFVPILNLFRPYQIMKEMSQETSRLIQSKIDDTPIIGWWWGLWIFTSLVGNYIARAMLRAESIDSLTNLTIASMAISVLGIPLAILTVRMIKSYAVKEEKILELELSESSIKEA